MGKKQVAVSLRKPPQVDGSDADAFVSEGSRSSYIDQLKDHLKDSIPGLRSLTVQLPHDLASRLLLRCMQDDRDVSNVVAELVEKHLDARPAEPDLHISVDAIVRWVRGKLSGLSLRRAT